MNDMREETSERYEGHAGIQLLSAGKDKQRDRDRRGEVYLVGVRVLQLDSLNPTHVVQISAVRREGKGRCVLSVTSLAVCSMRRCLTQ
jgi:hypothetical protein